MKSFVFKLFLKLVLGYLFKRWMRTGTDQSSARRHRSHYDTRYDPRGRQYGRRRGWVERITDALR